MKKESGARLVLGEIEPGPWAQLDPPWPRYRESGDAWISIDASHCSFSFPFLESRSSPGLVFCNKTEDVATREFSLSERYGANRRTDAPFPNHLALYLWVKGET